MSQHTPGPWKASNYHALGGYPVRTAEPDTTPIAIVPDLTNARLIAEAPAMLEVLRDLVWAARPSAARDSGRAILARIDGEQ